MTTGSWCLTEILKSWKPCSSNNEASHTADSTRASAVALPCFFSSRGSSEPALPPIRRETPASEAAAAISLTLSSNLRMLPGLTRTAPQPASMARSEEHTSELQSRGQLVCRLLLENRERSSPAVY